MRDRCESRKRLHVTLTTMSDQPHVTRSRAVVTGVEGNVAVVDPQLTASFARLEHDWMEALRSGDAVRTASYLAPEYALIIAAHPTRPVSRDQWVNSLPTYNMPFFEQREFVARRIGEVVVTSFIHRQVATVGAADDRQDRSGDFWVVDVWREINGTWKVASRYTYKATGESLPEA